MYCLPKEFNAEYESIKHIEESNRKRYKAMKQNKKLMKNRSNRI
jgi:hypothetical protein